MASLVRLDEVRNYLAAALESLSALAATNVAGPPYPSGTARIPTVEGVKLVRLASVPRVQAACHQALPVVGSRIFAPAGEVRR